MTNPAIPPAPIDPATAAPAPAPNQPATPEQRPPAPSLTRAPRARFRFHPVNVILGLALMAALYFFPPQYLSTQTQPIAHAVGFFIGAVIGAAIIACAVFYAGRRSSSAA